MFKLCYGRDAGRAISRCLIRRSSRPCGAAAFQAMQLQGVTLKVVVAVPGYATARRFAKGARLHCRVQRLRKGRAASTALGTLPGHVAPQISSARGQWRFSRFGGAPAVAARARGAGVRWCSWPCDSVLFAPGGPCPAAAAAAVAASRLSSSLDCVRELRCCRIREVTAERLTYQGFVSLASFALGAGCTGPVHPGQPTNPSAVADVRGSANG